MAPCVSIGMPVHNGEPFLEESLSAILGQEFEDFELIISDNASTDHTQGICERYASQDSRVQYYRSDRNRGAAANFNCVFSLASGKYFKWATCDDLLGSSYLSRSVEVFESAPPEVMLVYPKTVLIDEAGAELGHYEDGMDMRFSRPSDRLRHVVQHLDMCNVVLALIRRSALSQTRLIGRYIASDNVLIAELALLGQFREIPERLFYRRIHAGMYRKANPTVRERSAWLDPGSTGSHFPMFRVFVEHLKAVRRTPLTRRERIRCYAVVSREWLGRSRALAGEFVAALWTALPHRKGI